MKCLLELQQTNNNKIFNKDFHELHNVLKQSTSPQISMLMVLVVQFKNRTFKANDVRFIGVINGVITWKHHLLIRPRGQMSGDELK